MGGLEVLFWAVRAQFLSRYFPPRVNSLSSVRSVGFLTAGTDFLCFLNYQHWVEFSAAGAAGMIFH